jgi:hypothetical protein
MIALMGELMESIFAGLVEPQENLLSALTFSHLERNMFD